jgi:integrase
MAKALSVRSVENAKPGTKRREIADGLLPGHYLVVQQSGAKSFVVRYRSGGRTRKLTLGTYPTLDLKTSRERGAQALRAVAEGRDPAQEKRNARLGDTIEAIITQFVELHCRRANRPRTAVETERLLRNHVLSRWRCRFVQDLRRRDVLDLLDAVVADVSPKTGNSVFAALRKMLNWCVERDIIAASPCAGVRKPAQEIARDRVLSDSELVLVWKAAETIGAPFGSLIMLLMLSGQRRDEVAGMRWDELDIGARLWTLPPERVKNGERHEVPLSAPAIAIIQAVPRIAGSSYVLTTNGTSPSSGYGKGKRRIDALLPPHTPAWRLHDLRRTVASGMARLGIDLPVIEKVLGHRSGSFAGIVGVYQRHRFEDEKRAALEAWGRFVVDLMNDKKPDNVAERCALA